MGARLRELLDRAAAGAGFEPRIALESNESRRIRSMVSHGLGVAVLPRSDAERPGDEVAVCDLVEPSLTRDLTLASRTDRRPSPAARGVPRARGQLGRCYRRPGVASPA